MGSGDQVVGSVDPAEFTGMGLFNLEDEWDQEPGQQNHFHYHRASWARDAASKSSRDVTKPTRM